MWIDLDGGNNTVNIEATAPGVPVNIDLVTGIGIVNISPAASPWPTSGERGDGGRQQFRCVEHLRQQRSVIGHLYDDLLDRDLHGAATITYSEIDNVNLSGG